MRGFLLRWVLNTLALWILSELYSGVDFPPGAGLGDYLLAGLLLGLANALIRPVLLLLTLPLNVLTLGLFTLVINGLMLLLVAAFTALEVHGFLAAVVGALLLSVISFALNLLIGE